jgi:hypothetical protein
MQMPPDDLSSVCFKARYDHERTAATGRFLPVRFWGRGCTATNGDKWWKADVASLSASRHTVLMIDTRNGAARLLDFMPDGTLPSTSLRELTGNTVKASVGAFSSGLERRVADAWVQAVADLTCAQCRMLVGQRLGLQWLAHPVATFAERYPQAECDLYPGDLTVIALVVWRDLATYAPEATRRMLAQDYGWLRREADDDQWAGSILKQAVVALDGASRG